MSEPTFQSEWSGVLRVIDVKWQLLRVEVTTSFAHQLRAIERMRLGVVHPDA